MHSFIPLLLYSFSTTFTPGPNNFMMLNAGIQIGIKKSLPHYIGICIGFPIMVLLVSLGLGEFFIKYPIIKTILKIFGSLYMLYLAWQILTSHSKANSVEGFKPLSFFQAVMFQWVNPKAWLMAISTISLFTISNHMQLNAIIIAVTYFIMCIPCIGAWLVFGNALQYIIKKDSHRVWLNIFMAAALVASIAMIIFD